MSFYTLRNCGCLAILPVLICVAIRPPAVDAATSPDGNAKLLIGAAITNLPRAANKAIADYMEVSVASLRDLPVIVQVNIGTEPQMHAVPLTSSSGQRWTDQIDLHVELDGEVVKGHQLDLLPGAELAVSKDEGLRCDWTHSIRAPESLAAEDGLVAFFRLLGSDGPELVPGLYRINVRWSSTADEFFGLQTNSWGEVSFRVLENGTSSADRFLEDLIQRHYQWAIALYKFDRGESKREFEKAWSLVQQYLADGAGDETGYWNVTPRYQAMAIAERLDKHEEQFRYMQQIVGKNADASIGRIKLKMRYYHFGPAVDQLPRNQGGEMLHKLNRLYVQLNGKTMRGDPVPSAVPPRKYFADDNADDE